MKRLFAAAMVALLASAAACTQAPPGAPAGDINPVAPSLTQASPSPGTAPAEPLTAPLSGSNGHPLTAVVGQGTGIVNVTSQESQPFFVAEIAAAIERTSPGSIFGVKRRIDPNPDGVCTGATFLLWSGSEFTTSEGGAGSTYFRFENPHALRPFKFDMQIEVSTDDSSTVLRSDCFTVDVR